MEKKTIRQTGLEVIRRLENQEELQTFSEFQQKLRYFKKRFEDEEFRIAVVGEFSSGKSTFINALIGQDVLQHAKKETTATITRLVNVSPQDTRCGKGNVKLHSGEIVTLNDFTSLKEYTTTASDKLDVAAEVEQAELFVPLMKSTRPMVVVDTPGLNGIEGGHREQTMALVQQAHACIYLISRRGISESDTLLLRQLAAIQKNFIFIQNFIDDLNAAEGETLRQKLDEQKRILQEKVLYDAPDVKFSLCGVSALLALAAQDQSIDRLYAGVNEPKLTEEMRRQMYQRSNFQQLLDLLAETFQEKNLAEIQYGDSARALLDWMKQMASQVSLHSEQVSEAYELSRDRMAIKKLDEQAERTLKAQKDNEKKLTNFVLSQGLELRKKIKTEIKEVLSATEQYIDEDIAGYRGGRLPQDAIHSLEGYQKTMFVPLMEDELNRRFRVVQKNCVGEIDGIRSWLLEKIERSQDVKANVPQMRQVEQKGMKPSDVAEGVGRIAEMAFLLIPGSAWGSAAGSAAKALKNSGRVGTTLYKGLTVVANNSKVLNAVDAVNDTVTKTNWMSKLFTSKAKRQEMQDLKKIEALAAGAATKGVVALDEFKRSQGYDPDSDDNPTFLDMLSIPYWTKKVGKKFDAPPKYVDVGDQEGFKEGKKRLQEEIRQKQLKAFEMKQKLKFYDSQAEEMEAKRQAAVVDEEELERELKKHEQEIAAKARKDALEKWRENCGQWYRDQLQPELKKMIADARVQLPERLTYYQEKRLRSVRQRLEEKKAEYNKLMDAPAGEHAEDLERTTTLLNRIREVYANG